jgi:exosortase A
MNGATAWLPTPAALRRMAPGLLLIGALLFLFRDTLGAMVAIWLRSDTFAHAFLVPPIVVWLIWRQRDKLAQLPSRPVWWMVLPMAAMALLWLLGALAGLNAATQFALVGLLVLAVPLVFGLQVARALLFPLLFLFFAVPFGEFMVPSMMAWTADFTVAAVQLSGVPVFREGLQFVIPTGNWSVVEACSGVRYLIASFMVGTLFAYLNFKSLRKRLMFVAVSLMVPILANWLRAYLIVMIGHLSGNKLAVGVDHLVYGWAFFGVVIGVMFWIGARFADHDEPPLATSAEKTSPQAMASVPVASNGLTPWWVGGLALGLMALAHTGFWRLNQDTGGAAPALRLPAAYGNWAATPDKLSDWTPAFKHAKTVASGSFAHQAQQAAMWVGYYRDQGYDKKLISSTNLLTETEIDARWASVARGQHTVTTPGLSVQMTVSEVRAALSTTGITGTGTSHGAQRLRVWHTYWIGGEFVTSEVQARARLSLNRLMGKGDDAAVVIFYAAAPTPAENAQADANLEALAQRAMPALAGQLSATQLRR